jgi:hypothetical protein
VLARCAAWDLIKALEREAAFYSDVLKGLQDCPPSEQWASLTQRYQQLQQQATQQQDQGVAPQELEATLAAGLQPCQVGPHWPSTVVLRQQALLNLSPSKGRLLALGRRALGGWFAQHCAVCVCLCLQVAHVQLVEELRSQVDSLAHELQAARAHQQQDRHAQHCSNGGQQRADQQQAHCLAELAAMQQLAALVLQQLQLHFAMQQQGQAAVFTSAADAASPLLQLQEQQQQQAATALQQSCSLQPPHHKGSSGVGVLQSQCMRLRQQLQQLSQAADALVQHASAQGGGVSQCASRGAAHLPQTGCDLDLDLGEVSLTLQDPADSDDLSLSGSDTHGPVSDAIQQLREAMQGPGAVRRQQQDVRLHHALHAIGRNSSGSQQQEPQQQLQVVKLRLAYQQVLHKVQARYQRELRQAEVKHQEVGGWGQSCPVPGTTSST